MIAQFHRFHGQTSLRQVYQKGTTIRGPYANLKFLHRNQAKSYRVSVVVSRKVSKSAVVRNRIRRRLYEIVRRSADKIPKGFDMIILVYNEELATIPPQQVESAISTLLTRAISTKTEHERAPINEP